MYLIDSSAWIEYLRPRGSREVKERVRDILQKEQAISCGVVLVEILKGAKNERDFQALHKCLAALPQIPIDNPVIERAAHWGFILDRKGKVVSTTDLLIAAAAYKKARLLHIDSNFELISSEVELEEEGIGL